MNTDRESRRIAAPTNFKVFRILHFLALIAIAFASPSGATAQRPDHLQYLGTSHEVHRFDISREMADSFSKYKQRLRESGTILEDSSNWDGFDAELSIIEGKLLLMSIRIDIDHFATTEEVFGVSIPGDGLLADWFSGRLFEYYGDPVEPFGRLSHARSKSTVFHFHEGVLLKVEKDVPFR